MCLFIVIVLCDLGLLEGLGFNDFIWVSYSVDRDM